MLNPAHPRRTLVDACAAVAGNDGLSPSRHGMSVLPHIDVVALEEAAGAELGAASLGRAKPFPAEAVHDVQASMARSAQGEPARPAAWRT